MTRPPRRLSADDVISIHAAAIAKFGGCDGIRDMHLLHSALAQPFQAFGGEELYPSIGLKAARYAFGIVKDHPFVDGNKRTATAVMGAFLRINGRSFRPDKMELLDSMIALAGGESSFDQFADWVERQVK